MRVGRVFVVDRLASLVGESAAPEKGPEWKTAAVEYPLTVVPGERVVQRV